MGVPGASGGGVVGIPGAEGGGVVGNPGGLGAGVDGTPGAGRGVLGIPGGPGKGAADRGPSASADKSTAQTIPLISFIRQGTPEMAACHGAAPRGAS